MNAQGRVAGPDTAGEKGIRKGSRVAIGRGGCHDTVLANLRRIMLSVALSAIMSGPRPALPNGALAKQAAASVSEPIGLQRR